MINQTTKFELFRALHALDEAFVIPNAWDAGSSRILSSLGFEAIATSSAGYAFSKGKRDSFARCDILKINHDGGMRHTVFVDDIT